MHGGTIRGVLARDDATQDAILSLALGDAASGARQLTMTSTHRRELSVAMAIAADRASCWRSPRPASSRAETSATCCSATCPC